MKSLNIAIIDQDRSSVNELKKQLHSLDHHYLTVTQSSDNADQQIIKTQPQVIVVNTKPNQGGQLLNMADDICKRFDIPVILIINLDESRSLEASKSSCPYHFVTRPIRDTDLQAALELAQYCYLAEKTNQEKNQQLQAVLRSSGEGFITFDLQYQINYVNTVAEMLTGWQQDDAYGRKVSEVFIIIDEGSGTKIEVSELLSKRSKTGPLTELDTLLINRNGDRIPIKVRASTIRDHYGNIHGGVIAFGNISELQQAIQQAQLQTKRAEALLGIISKLNSQLDLDKVLLALLEETTSAMGTEGSAVVLLKDDGITFRVVAVHSTNERLQDYKGDEFEIENLSHTSLVSSKDPVLVLHDLKSTRNFPYSDLLIQEDVRTVALVKLQRENQLLGLLVILSTGKIREYSADEQMFLKGLADQGSLAITNARLFENVRNSRTRMQYLSKRLVEVQETERRYLAQELHDQVGQMLTGLHFILESGKRKAPEELKPVFEETQEMVSEMINQVRNLSLRLLPSMLDDIGLLPTLLWHFDLYTQQTGIRVNFSHENLDQQLPQDIQVTAYRIIQEGLTNAARYAQVDNVDVIITIDDETARLEVIDHGVGFDTEKTVRTRRSFGLIGMRERAYLVGGILNVNSSPGKGTKLTAILPLQDHLERRKYARKSFNRG